MAKANKKTEPAIRKQRWLKYFTYIFITGVVVLGIFYHFIVKVAIVISIAALLELIKVNFIDHQHSFKKTFISFLVFFPVAAGFILFTQTFYASFLLFVYFQVLVFDGFCQITGQLFGKHQLAPAISAAKTIEGLIGGWIFCLIAAIMCARWIGVSWIDALPYGLLTGFSAFSGDILASWYKRIVKVKDYSNWLPGQGGFLDRFDSFLMTGTFYFLLYKFIFKDSFTIYLN